MPANARYAVSALDHFHVQGVKEIPSATSCTSKEQQWHKPRGKDIAAESLMQCIFPKANTDRNNQRSRSPLRTRMYDARGCDIRKSLCESEIMKVKSPSSASAPFSYLLNKSSGHERTFVETMFGSVGTNSPLSYKLKNFGSCSTLPFDLF